MVTVSHLVKKYVDESPFISEAMTRGILSNPGLAEELKPKLEKDLNKKISLPAIIMALRRHADEMQTIPGLSTKKKISHEISLRTGISVIAVKKNFDIFKNLDKMYKIVDIGSGDTLNISHGNNEVSIIISDKYSNEVLALLKKENIVSSNTGLVSLTLTFDKHYIKTPGMIFAVIRRLAWNNINIIELVSANTELSIIIKKVDVAKAYQALEDIFK